MRDIVACRTAVLGGHLDVCDTCGHAEPSYNSCRNRHCPKCQCLAQARWIEQRKQRVLPTDYFHLVFTLPALVRPLARCHPRRIYDLLFKTASSTLLELAKDEKRLGATLGITAVLHTWTRELNYHPHLHLVVTGGGLAPEDDRWIPAKRRYLFPVKVLSRLFRGKFLDALRRAREKGEIGLLEEHDFETIVRTLYRQEWVVFAQRPFAGAHHVYEYLGRYTHRVAISNPRLLEIDEAGVRFLTKEGDSVKLAHPEFIRRFLLHVLPRRYVKIRHYGLMAAGNATTRLEVARDKLAEYVVIPEAPDLAWPVTPLDELTARPCPRCHQGRLTLRLPLDPLPLAPDTS
jgi:hypothetical protein